MDLPISLKPKARYITSTAMWLCYLPGKTSFAAATLPAAVKGWRLVNG